ncbi:MAG TPA: hypothetical protein VGP79_11645 [Bryobacteraceae bacterium]|nr:hypothetical protein [Bryobacteraceae bacterium]
MASGTTNPFEEAAALFGKAATGNSAAGDPLLQVAQQLQKLYSTNETLIEATKASTQAVKQSSGTSSGASVLATIGKSLQTVFGSGLGLSPLISGIASLFGGGGEASELAPVVKFALPTSVQAQAGIVESSPTAAFGVDYGQGGIARAVTQGPQITVQVQALDSQSFLDRSQDIALAVRRAMLESSVLSDVIREA